MSKEAIIAAFEQKILFGLGTAGPPNMPLQPTSAPACSGDWQW